MITKQDISVLFSEAYAKASLAEKCDMRFVADLFESIRIQMDISDPFTPWDFMIIDGVKFDGDDGLELLLDLQDSYFTLLFEKLLYHLNALYSENKEEALSLWTRYYAEAAVHYRDDLICMLCYQKYQWGINDPITGRYSRLSAYIRETRWPDAFPYYEEIAADTSLPAEIRGYAEITLAEIILYYFPEYSGALKHLENARALLPPDHFMIRKGEAEYNLKIREIQKARDGFLQIIVIKPGDHNSLEFIGDCFVEEGMLENAEYWYNESVRKNFLQRDPYKRLLNLYGQKSWLKEKEPLMHDLLAKIEKREEWRNPSSLIEKKLATRECFTDLALYQSYRDVAACWSAINEFEKAEEWYLKAKDLHPGIATAILDLGYIKLDREQPDKALEYFLEALEKDKDNFEVFQGLGFYYKEHGDTEKALKYFNECLRLRPHVSDWINNYIGNLYFSAREYKESEFYYRKAVGMNGNYLIYRQNLAGSLAAQADSLAEASKYDEAEKLYLEAIEWDNNADRWNIAGNFYFDIQRWPEAAGCFEKAIALRNTDPVLLENLGLTFEKLGKYPEAERMYTQAAELDKNSGNYYNRLGILYFDQKQYEKAIENYLKAIAIEKDNGIFLTNLGMAYMAAGRKEDAMVTYEEAVKFMDDFYVSWNDMGVINFEQGKLDAAIDCYNKAIALRPDDPVLFSNLALALNAQGKTKEALEVANHPLLPNDDVKKQVEIMLHQNLQFLYEGQN